MRCRPPFSFLLCKISKRRLLCKGGQLPPSQLVLDTLRNKMFRIPLPVGPVHPVIPAVQIDLVHPENNRDILGLPLFPVGIPIFHPDLFHHPAAGRILLIVGGRSISHAVPLHLRQYRFCRFHIFYRESWKKAIYLPVTVNPKHRLCIVCSKLTQVQAVRKKFRCIGFGLILSHSFAWPPRFSHFHRSRRHGRCDSTPHLQMAGWRQIR